MASNTPIKISSKPVKIGVFFIASILLISCVFNLFQDVDFFIHKTEATAQILNVKDLGPEEPNQVTVKYFNEKANKNDTTNIDVKKTYEGSLNQNNKIEIIYNNNWPETIYVLNGGNPRLAILIVDIIVILLMYFIMTTNKWW